MILMIVFNYHVKILFQRSQRNSTTRILHRMQKVLLQAISHMNFQEATSAYEELKGSHFLYHSPQTPLIQKTHEKSPFSNSRIANNNQLLASSRSQQKNFNNNVRINRLNSEPPLPHLPNNITSNPPSFFPPMPPVPHQNLSAQQQSAHKSASKESIIRKYDEFFGQKINIDMLKQQNSRLYYEKMALQSSLIKLKQENIKKDSQISRLKEYIDHNNKNTHVQMPVSKQFQAFNSQVVNQQPAHLHFRSTIEQKRLF